MSESVVLCEGYHDRAFWAGWLKHLGCTDPGEPRRGEARRPHVYDPGGKVVTRGQFGFHSKSGAFIRVVPCHGKDKVWEEARDRLAGRKIEQRLNRLVVNRDMDVTVANTSSLGGASDKPLKDLLHWVREKDASAVLNEQGEVALDNSATKVSLIRWEALDQDAEGLPEKQTLERLVCAAMIEAYPQRAQAVQKWLESRPNAPSADPKEHAWSYMAGWYAAHGCEDFYRTVWDDPDIVVALRARLDSSGAWHFAETLAR